VRNDENGRHRRSFNWDPAAVIAIVVIVGAFTLAIVSMLTDAPEHSIPAWVAALVSGIGLYYYKKNGGEK
jgi:protein-S-isoprenylcysteine O-methyltransferase Ste14